MAILNAHLILDDSPLAARKGFMPSRQIKTGKGGKDEDRAF